MQKIITLIGIIISCNCAIAQNKFRVKVVETKSGSDIYSLVDEQSALIRTLDTSIYQISFNNDSLRYFAIFGIKGKQGWYAIDIDENILFKVYNTSIGEPSPDCLRENRIRIVDKKNKIGFANHKGRIVILPQYEIVTSFHKGKAIIGKKCKKIPWGSHKENGSCEHYSIKCLKHGWINKNGEVLEMGNYSFDTIKNEINWKDLE